MTQTTPLQQGDIVYLANGPYQGTAGVFRFVVEDPGWASITEVDGRVRSHPLLWLRAGVFPVGRSPLGN